MRPAVLALAAIVAAFSGFYSLVYQVTWDRIVRFNIGGDTVSSAIVTSSFLLGLGIGAWLFGSWHRRAARTLGLLEIGIGLFAIASYRYLAPLAATLGGLFGGSLDDTVGLRVAIIAASMAFLVPPSILMGGTLPLMFNTFIRRRSFGAGAVGYVYGLNTLGAATGVVAAPLLLLNHWSIPTVLGAIGAADVVFGALLAVFAGRIERLAGSTDATDLGHEATMDLGDASSVSLPWIWVLSACSGGLVLGVEISLFRHFFIFNPSSPYNFPMVLLPYLLGLALGSVLLTRGARNSVSAIMLRAGVLFVAAQAWQLAAVWSTAHDVLLLREMTPLQLTWHWFGLTFPYAFFSGAVFPLLLRAASVDSHALPRRTGSVYLTNSVGSFSLALLIQFVGFPVLGTRRVALTLAYIGIAAGVLCLLLARHARQANGLSAPRRAAIASVLIVAASLPLLVPRSAWGTYTYRQAGPDFMPVEGVSGIAAIRWNEGRTQGSVLVNGQYMSALPDHPKHVRLAAFALMHERRARILVLGVGGGGMIRELLADTGVERVDVVDWSREVIELLDRRPARMLLADALRSDHVRVFINDARVAVAQLPAGFYDLVVDNLAIGDWVGATNIKSRQFYRQVARVLAPGGVFVYDANPSSPDQRAANLAALHEAFDVVVDHKTAIWLASDEPIRLDPARVEAVLEPRAATLGLEHPPFSEWVLPNLRPVSESDVAGVEPLTDELLIHEYRGHWLCTWLH